jgi:hypothetical protein
MGLIFGREICPKARFAGQRGPPLFYQSLYSGKTPGTEQPCSAPGVFIFAVRKFYLFKRPASHRGGPGRSKEHTMKTKHGFLFGFAVIAIAAMFTLAGCPTEDNGDGGGGGVKGKLTITDIPTGATDSYLIVTFGFSRNIFGLAEKPASTDSDAQNFKAVKITGTTVELPLWKLDIGSSGVSWVGYEAIESKEGTAYFGTTEKTSQNGLSAWGTTTQPIGNISFTNGIVLPLDK